MQLFQYFIPIFRRCHSHPFLKQIAEILGISKSQVTRDLQYIKLHGYEFIQKLKDYMGRIEDAKETDYFRRKLVFDRQKQLLEWLKIARRALDYLVREIGVAKN